MSAHRQHTFDIPSNPQPIEQVPYRREAEPSLLITPPLLLVVGALAFGWLFAAISYMDRPTAEVAPVHQAHVDVTSLEPVHALDGAQLAQIRVEAFRAGMQSAQENCLGAPVLSLPIARRE